MILKNQSKNLKMAKIINLKTCYQIDTFSLKQFKKEMKN